MTVLDKAQKTGIQAVAESLAEIPVADAVLTADRTALLPQLLSATPIYILYFYRAMHFSAKRGIAIACRLSVCLSVCL